MATTITSTNNTPVVYRVWDCEDMGVYGSFTTLAAAMAEVYRLRELGAIACAGPREAHIRDAAARRA